MFPTVMALNSYKWSGIIKLLGLRLYIIKSPFMTVTGHNCTIWRHLKVHFATLRQARFCHRSCAFPVEFEPGMSGNLTHTLEMFFLFQHIERVRKIHVPYRYNVYCVCLHTYIPLGDWSGVDMCISSPTSPWTERHSTSFTLHNLPPIQ